MGGWLTDFTTDIYVLGGEGQTITSPFYTLGNEMSLAYDWLPYLRDKFIVTGGDIGRAAIWKYDYPIRIQNHIHRLRPYTNISIRFYYYIFYLYKNIGLIGGKGIGIQGLSSNAIHQLLFPLPPLQEQNKIVAAIESLIPYCERL